MNSLRTCAVTELSQLYPGMCCTLNCSTLTMLKSICVEIKEPNSCVTDQHYFHFSPEETAADVQGYSEKEKAEL